MAGEWRASTWGDEISLEYGKALRGHDTSQGGYRVYGSNGPIGWTSTPLAPGPGVILGRKGAYRGVQFSRDPFFVIDTAYFVVPKSELDMRWLYYAIQHYKLGEVDDGSPIPSTTRAAVYVLDLDVPPLDEQRAIAHILGTLDDKIELNRRMSETLEAMARALFKSWFVDFDPVRAKAEGRDPGLPKEIADLFPDSFEDSELGEIPRGWQVKSIGDLAMSSEPRRAPRTASIGKVGSTHGRPPRIFRPYWFRSFSIPNAGSQQDWRHRFRCSTRARF
jgi:type I restriction enzyme S subunit